MQEPKAIGSAESITEIAEDGAFSCRLRVGLQV